MIRFPRLIISLLLLMGLMSLPSLAVADDTDSCRGEMRCPPQSLQAQKGSIELSAPEVLEGDLKQRAIAGALQRQIRSLKQACYSQFLTVHPDAAGTLKLHLILQRRHDDRGRPVALRVQDSSIPGDLESCVLRQLLSSDFHAPSLESDRAKIEFLLTFEGPGDDSNDDDDED